MAQFSGGGGNKQTGPWGRPLDMQPLVAFPNQGVYQQLPPGLAAMGAAVSGGGPTPGSGAGPAVSLPMHNQVNPAAYPRALAPAFGSQQMLQQQQQAAAAAVASLQQQQQQQQQQSHAPHPSLQGNNPHPPPDRVLVEANYNTNMPFKWNASRIQVMPNSNRSSNGGVNPTATPNTLAFTSAAMSGGGVQHKGATKQRVDYIDRAGRGGGLSSHNVIINSSSVLAGSNRVNHSPPNRGGPSRNSLNCSSSSLADKPERDRRGARNDDRSRFMDRDNDRNRDKDRGRSPAILRKRSRSPRRTRSRSRSRSPPRRRPRTTPRYNVFVPKISLHFPKSSIIDLKKRYGTMYVPSDFFASDHSWMDSFPMHQPLNVHSPAVFHVFNKDSVEPPILSDAVYDPPDADHTYNVKIMLMASLPPDEFYEKTCLLSESGSRDSLIHPTRAIQFLVGLRGKNETMAIGGPWSPSLDGPNPDKDPSVLIKTAIRACRSLTGIDLSSCTQWHRFLEIHYRRLESSSRPARTETTVIFLPDVWSVMPTRSEFDELQSLYTESLNAKINPESKVVPKKKPESSSEGEDQVKTENKVEESKADNKNNEMESKETEGSESKDQTEEKSATCEEEDSSIPDGGNQEPSSWRDLDPKSMKVNDLRSELTARGLSSKGLKSQLVGRLTKELKQEQNKEENKEGGEEESEATPTEDKMQEGDDQRMEEDTKEEPEVMEVERPIATTTAPIAAAAPTATVSSAAPKKKEPVKLDDKQKATLTNAYKLPSQRCIPVHPHPKAKSGKFDCTVMSLSVLLDYRTEDNKEGTFEVSLFAELFNEMLMRDAAFKIYKVLLDAVNSKKQQQSSSAKEGGGDSSESSKAATESTGDEERNNPSPPPKRLDKEALAAFSYFDQGHCGYLEVKEVEDIFYILHIDISRSQVKKLISKVLSSKDQLHYRPLIERTEEEANAAGSGDEEKEKRLAMGFRAFISERGAGGGGTLAFTESQEEGVTVYKGKVVDVGKLLSQLARSEKALMETEATLNSTTKSLTELQHASEKTNSLKDKLSNEVKDLKKKVRTAEDELKKSQSNSVSYVATLKDIYHKVSPLVVNHLPPPTPSAKEEQLPGGGGTKEDENSTTNGGNSLKAPATPTPAAKADK
eukprot:TRINITY_DN948_c0_g3_i2.p1 TRINITY_DN948_c0_g3~~TRINITY_DN948_c0_g3_i2.p1  ORF type:complete len:1140 (-),score=383.85 TRINITY_DN948_c0_g3_i2:278-3697(-)